MRGDANASLPRVLTAESDPAARDGIALTLGVSLLVLLAFAVRLYGLSDLHLQGDSAYSVWVAQRSLAAITASRSLDGHPPLYYYILHLFIRLAGISELTVRLPAVLLGVALVPVAYRLARTLAGSGAGLAAALLVALSPDLVFLGRQARMYSLLPLAAAVSWLLLERAIRRGRYAWLWHSLATAIGLFSHYYMLLSVAGQGLYVLTTCRGATRRHALASLVAAALPFAPWGLWAIPSQAWMTAGVLGNAPAPPGLLGFVQEVWLPYDAGLLVESRVALWLGVLGALALLAAVAGGAAGRRRRLRDRSIPLPAAATVLPILFSLAIFAVDPIAVRARFLVVALPSYLIVLAALLTSARRGIALSVLAVVLAADGYALWLSYPADRAALEADAIQIAQHLDRWGRPGDAIVFQAGWEIGYLSAHPPTQRIDAFELNDFTAAGVDQGRWRRIWLAAYNTQPRDLGPGRTLEDSWGKAAEWTYGPTRLVLYVAPPEQGPSAGQPVRFVAGGRPQLALTGSGLGVKSVAAGESFAVRLDWLAESAPAERVTAFVHVGSPALPRLVGSDREPAGEWRPTSTWAAGEQVTDVHGVSVPLDAPPGEYDVVAGLYETGGANRLAVEGQVGRDTVVVGRIRVEPTIARPARAMAAPVGGLLEVTGLTTDLDRFVVGESRVVGVNSVDRLTLTTPRVAYRPGQTAELEVQWRRPGPAREPLALEVRAVGPTGLVLSAPAARPAAGESGVSLFRLAVPENAPVGAYGLSLVAGEHNVGLAAIPVGH